MLTEWTALVQAEGVTARPSFASGDDRDAAHGIEDDVASIRDALLYPVRDEMWQLCSPTDLRALEVDTPTLSIRFASRLTQETLRSLPATNPCGPRPGHSQGCSVSSRCGPASPCRPGQGRAREPVDRAGAVIMADVLRFRRVYGGEYEEIPARVDDAEFPAGNS